MLRRVFVEVDLTLPAQGKEVLRKPHAKIGREVSLLVLPQYASWSGVLQRSGNIGERVGVVP